MVELDLFILIPVIAAFVGILVGLVSIYQSIKSTKEKGRLALEKSIIELKSDLKEYIDLNLEVMDIKVCAVRDELKLEAMFTAELNRRSDFFTKWTQRLEDRVNSALEDLYEQ